MVTRIPSKDALGVRFPLNAFTIEFYMYILIYIEHMPKSRRVKKKRTRGDSGPGTMKSRGLSHSSSTSSLPSSSSRPRLPRSSSAGVLSRSSSTSKSSHDSSTKTPEKTNLSIIQTHQKRIYMLANMIM